MSGAIVVTHATKVIHGRVVLDDVTLTLPRGGIYGFSGINGSGKTMLFRAISGLIHLTSGQVDVFGQRIGVDVNFPRSLGLVLESAGFWDESTGLRNLTMLASIRGVAGEAEARAALARVGLAPDDDRPFSAYSMGMRQRLTIAQAIMEAPELLILDEPTNHLDLSSREWIEEAVADYTGNLLFVSHDRYFIRQFATRIWMLEDGRITDFDGTFEEYRAWKEKKLAVSPSKKEEAEPKKERPRRTGGTKLLEKEVATAEREVARAEERMYDLTREIEDAASDYLKLTELYEQREALEEEIAHLYATWERLSAELEEVKAE